MKELEHGLGEYVFLIYNNKVERYRITQIGLSISENNKERVWYSLQGIGGNRDGKDLFKTKEELLRSL